MKSVVVDSVVLRGLQGPPGAYTTLAVTFDFTDSAAPKMIGIVPSGAAVRTVTIDISTPFNDASGTLSIGTDADNAALFTLPANHINDLAEFGTAESYAVASATAFNLYLSSVASMGAGTAFVTYDKGQ